MGEVRLKLCDTIQVVVQYSTTALVRERSGKSLLDPWIVLLLLDRSGRVRTLPAAVLYARLGSAVGLRPAGILTKLKEWTKPPPFW